jgi:hypothetical protein
VRLIDSGEATADAVALSLATENLARAAPASDAGSDPTEQHSHSVATRRRDLCDDLDHFYVTDAAERFARVAERFLGSAPRVLEAVEVWGHDELHTQ